MRVLETEKEAKKKENRGERRRRIRHKTQVMNIRGERREKGRTKQKDSEPKGACWTLLGVIWVCISSSYWLLIPAELGGISGEFVLLNVSVVSVQGLWTFKGREHRKIRIGWLKVSFSSLPPTNSNFTGFKQPHRVSHGFRVYSKSSLMHMKKALHAHTQLSKQINDFADLKAASLDPMLGDD